MTKDEAMRMALDALNNAHNLEANMQELRNAIDALRTALTQPDEQIGITYEEANLPQQYCQRCGKKLGTEVTDIHTCTPIRKEWVGLTKAERSELWWSTDMGGMPEHDYGKKVEALLKEKNNDS